MMTLFLFWLVLFLVVVLGQSVLLVWYSWPAIRRMLHCPWCWQSCHLMQHYPARWSSTMCPHHAQHIRTQLAARRAQRLAHS